MSLRLPALALAASALLLPIACQGGRDAGHRDDALRSAPAGVAAPEAERAVAPDPGKGYRQHDGLFAGVFGDLLNNLQLELQGEQVVGRCDFGADWELVGEVKDGVLTGTATALVAKKPFTARFEADRLRLRIGEQDALLARLVPLDQRLADLGPPVDDPDRQWTVALYLGGDNNLEDAAIDDLQEMMAGLPARGVEVVVLLDRARHPPEVAAEDGVWSDTRVLHVRHKPAGAPADAPNVLLEPLAKPGELDTGDARTLAGFLVGAFRKYPAPHRAVLIWDHGGGWTGVVNDQDAPGTAHGTDMLTLYDVRVALQTAQLRGPAPARFDVLLFDACLMSHLETAIAVQDAARWLVASQASVPGTGYPYTKVLPAFVGATDGGQVARAVVGAFGAAYEQAHDSGVTLAATDLDAVAEVAAQLDRFAAGLLPVVGSRWTALGRALFYAESYQPRTNRDTPKWVASLDLLDLVHRIATAVQPLPPASAAAMAALDAAVAKAVVARHAGEQRLASHGLSVFGPFHGTPRMQAYADTALGAGNAWTELLRRVHELAHSEQTPLAVADVVVHGSKDAGADVVRPCNGDGITFRVSGRAVVEAVQEDVWFDGTDWVVLRKNFVRDPRWPRRLAEAAADEADRTMPAFQDGDNACSSELTGVGFLIDNRDEHGVVHRATLDLAAPSTQSPILVVAQFTRKATGQTQDVELHFDRAWWRCQGVYPLHCEEEELEARRLVPAAEDEFRFVQETVAEDGTRGRALTEPMTWHQGLWLILVADEPGRYRAVLRARTLDGREATAAAAYELRANPDLDAWGASWQQFAAGALRGRWPQQEVMGPAQLRDTGIAARFLGNDPMGPGVFRVETEIGRGGKEGVTHQTWVFEQRGLPNLRVITEIADGRQYCWYGPAFWDDGGDRPAVMLKAVNVGVIWRWQMSVLDSLLMPGPATGGGADKDAPATGAAAGGTPPGGGR